MKPIEAVTNYRKRPRSLWMLLSLLWVGLIFLGSSTAAEQFCEHAVDRVVAWCAGDDQSPLPYAATEDRFWLKKATHVTLFLVLAFILSRAFRGSGPAALVFTLGAGVTVGIASECIQLFFPTREATVRDALINAAATLVGAMVFSRTTVPSTADDQI